MAEQSGFVLPIYADDGGTIAAMEGRVNALVGSLDRAAKKVQEVNDQLKKSGKGAEANQTPNAAWTKARADAVTAKPAVLPAETGKDNRWEATLRTLREANQELLKMQNLGDVLRGITNEKVLKEQLLGAEQAFSKLQLAAAKAVNTMSLYEEKQLQLTRANLAGIAAAKERVAIEARMATALAKSGQSYRDAEAATLRKEAANQRALIPLKMELDLQAKLAKARADAQFRTANKVDIASLQALNREQMVNLETTKAIDKLYRDHAKAAATLSKEYQEARAQLAPLTQAQQVHLQQIKLLDEWNTKLAKAMAMQSAPVQAAIKQYNDLTNKVERATKASKVFSESMSGTNQITAGFRAALAGVGMGFGIYTSGTILAASATYTVVAAFRDVIASGAEFEKEMARVNAAMNLTGEQYDDLSKRAIEMAASSRYSTNEIVKAYREMAMSGFTYQETVDGIGAVMAMASIGMMEFGEAADIATNVLFGFNLEAKDLSEVVDVLAKTVTNSAQDLRQLGNTMSYVAPVAASYGLSLEMVAAATEVLANAGIKGSRSGTGLRRTLTALFSDSENVAGVLGELGVSVNMLASDMDQEFLRVLKALNTATSGATTNVGKLSDAVGLYAIPTFLNLVKAADGSVDSLQALAEKYNDVGGAAYEMQKRMENALAVDWDKANAAISAIKTELFLMYGGDLRQFVQDMTAWIRALADSKDTLREVISLMKDLLVTVGQVTAAIIGLSMVKGAANFAGSAVAAYKGVKEAAATRVAPAAVGMAEGMANGAILATAAATASTRDITAVTAATRGAAEATTMWAAAKKVLGVAFRAVPYIGTALILKDMYDIYQGLNVVVPKQADEVNQLADAQRRLNETFKGFRFSKANEGYTIDVAKTKRSLDELGASLEATQNKILDVEGQIDRALQAGIQDPARLRLLFEELGKLRKQYGALIQEAEAGETKLSRTAHTLIAKEREALTQQAINLERLRDQAQQAYDRALAEMNKKSVIAPQGGDQELAKYRKQYEEMNGLDFLSNGLGFNATFEEYLRKVNPALATLEKNLSDAKAALLKANREAETFNANLKTQENALDATENSLGAYNLTIKDTAKSLAYSQKLTAFFEGQAAAIRKVREESELENKTTQEKMSYYQQQIDHYDTIKNRMESLQGYAVELTRLIALYEEMDAQNGDLPLPGLDQTQLDYFRQQLAGLESAFGWLKANEGARLGWETSMAGLGETTDDTTKAVEELRQSLWDLLNLPNEMDFTKTLKGQVDFAIAQADALLAKYAKLSGEYAGLPARGAMSSPSSGGGAPLGGGYSALNQTQQSYVTKVASALSMKDAAKEVLAQALPAIDKYSQKYNVSREEVIALITAENRDWNTRAANPKSSAYGLGQILEGTRKDISAAIKRPFAELTDSIDGQIEATVYYYSQRTQGKSSFGGAVSEWHSGPGGYPGGAKGAAQAKEGAELVSRANRALSALSGIDKALGNFADTGGGYGPNLDDTQQNATQNAAATALKKQETAQKAVTQATKEGDAVMRSAVATDEDRSQALIVQADAMLGMAKTNDLLASSIDAQVAKEQEALDPARVRDLIERENQLYQLRIKNRAELAAMPIDNLTQEQIDKKKELIALDKEIVAGIELTRAARKAEWEEAVKQGNLDSKTYTRTPEELKAVGEGYNSVWARSRKYYAVMKDINDLEKAGYLSETEAALERIDASLEKMDPFTKEFSENIVGAFQNVITGAEDAETAMAGLKKTLIDMTLDKYVIKIGVNMVGSLMEPVVKGLESFGMDILKGVGSMLMSGLGQLASGLANAFMSGGNAQGAQSMASTAGGLLNSASSLSNLWSVGSNLFSGSGMAGYAMNYGAAMLSGAGPAQAAMLAAQTGEFGLAGATATSSALGGVSASGIGATLMAAAPYIAVAAAAYMVFNKWVSDQKPRYGAFSATTGGGTGGLEDAENGPENYSKGAFGLTFGLSDIGSKNMDASEMKELFDGFAKITESMAEFYGKDVSAKIEAALTASAGANWSKDGIMRLSMDADGALREIVTMISDAAAATGDDVAIVMDAILGTVTGTMEEVAKQLETAMSATKQLIELMPSLDNTDMAAAFDLTGTAAENAAKLAKFADTMKQAGETTADAVVRIANELSQLQFALDHTATSLEGMNKEQIAGVASELAKAFGGVEKLAAAQQFYYEQFTTASEKANDAIEKVLKKLKADFPKIKEDLLALNSPDKIKIEIPTLKEDLKEAFRGVGEQLRDFGGPPGYWPGGEHYANSPYNGYFQGADWGYDPGTSGFTGAGGNGWNTTEEERAWLMEQSKNWGLLSAENMKNMKPEGWNTTEEERAWLMEQSKNWGLLSAENMKNMKPEGWQTTEEERAWLMEQSKNWGLFGNLPDPGTGTGGTGGDKYLAEVQANAKAALRAAEMYAFGVENGTITKNAETEAKINAALLSYTDELTQMGYDVSQGLFGIVDQIHNWAQTSFMSDADRQALTKDPNAEIYAKLVNDMPTSREEFNALIGQINLTTEAGRLLYAELMKLAPAFDAMYDSIEGFEKWLGVKDEKDLAQARLDKVFKDLGIAVPKTKEALKALYTAGKLTAEQMAILGANLEDLDTIFGAADTWDPYEDLTNATIAKLEASLQKFTEELNKSKAIVSAAQSAIESLHKISQNTESYQEEMRDRARAALKNQRLPDDINDIINGLAQINEQDYGSYEEFMAAVQENENLIRIIKGRAETQVNWDQKQVDLLQEQIDLAKEALLKERTEMQEYIQDLQKELKDAYEKLQTLWDTGIGATNTWLQLISDTRLLDIQTELQVQGDRAYALQDKGFTDILAQLRAMAATTIPQPVVAPPSLPPNAVAHEPPTRDYGTATVATNTEGDATLAELILEVQGLRKETRETQTNLVVYSRRAADMLYRWEGDGLPPDREDYLRQIAYNTRDNTTTLCD